MTTAKETLPDHQGDLVRPPNPEPIPSRAGSPGLLTYIDSLAVDIRTCRGSRGRGVGDSVSARLADVNLGGGDFQSSAGHLQHTRHHSLRRRLASSLAAFFLGPSSGLLPEARNNLVSSTLLILGCCHTWLSLKEKFLVRSGWLRHS